MSAQQRRLCARYTDERQHKYCQAALQEKKEPPKFAPMLSRRTLLIGAMAGAGLPGAAFAQAGSARALSFQNLHTGERLDAAFFDHGAFVPDALAAINRVLRDHRTGEIHAIDVRLLMLLTDLRSILETREPLQVISGYRSPQTNAALADASAGVARRSLHMQGMAIDIAIEGTALDRIRQAALELRRGGVGHYPNPGFVHVDVGRVRSW
ncbi:MAG: DUF882 domain-containing protein [Hyphomonadaceae bacterium]